jgi:hypothetical protein
MKTAKYIVIASCGNPCPTVMEKPDSDEVVVIGTLMSTEEEADMVKTASSKVGVAPHEKTVRIPRAIFEKAVDNYLTQKAKKR